MLSSFTVVFAVLFLLATASLSPNLLIGIPIPFTIAVEYIHKPTTPYFSYRESFNTIISIAQWYFSVQVLNKGLVSKTIQPRGFLSGIEEPLQSRFYSVNYYENQDVIFYVIIRKDI